MVVVIVEPIRARAIDDPFVVVRAVGGQRLDGERCRAGLRRCPSLRRQLVVPRLGHRATAGDEQEAEYEVPQGSFLSASALPKNRRDGRAFTSRASSLNVRLACLRSVIAERSCWPSSWT